ncbi:kelch motif protein (macronuclear) [Tetrahymena thermophila SB210]|uniref:Kelch motif protein n=1 Tax=Tetrahymena thermophila (strain SB210) TaxID=312017 RepID=Q231V6_TETTS|nr:kelch motif protein [Tetrahymena thermophila SB210]EAR91344.2 kelch motif protein [Tetrahymena thermophila SB210]|eukprot:XP_001011589.2 kelch motif protein [Tetrahymena thermophila SB210]
MGQKNSKPMPEFIYMKKDNNQLLKTLCYFNKDDSGQIIELVFQNGSFEQILESEFIKFLDRNKEKEIKIITTLGEQGQGKSFIQNFLISKFQNCQDYLMVFPSSQRCQSVTKGIQFYAIEYDKQVLVFFDCQGFDYSDKSNYMQDLQKLVCLICRISTVILYVHMNSRQPMYLANILNLINIVDDNHYQIVNNLIEVINNCNGDKIESYQESYEQIIKKVFQCEHVSFNSEYDDQQYSCKIKNDENFNKFIQQIEQIQQFCEKSQYKTPFENCKAFEKEQNCQSFKEMLICCFQIIKEGIKGNMNVNQFISIINEQLVQKQIFKKQIEESKDKIKSQYSKRAKELIEYLTKSHVSYALIDFLTISSYNLSEITLKQELKNSIQKWKIEFQTKLNEIFTDNQILLNDVQKEKIIDYYSNLESIKPSEMRIYEKMKKKLKKVRNFSATLSKVIKKCSYILIISLELVPVAFIKHFIDNKKMKNKIFSDNNYLIQRLIEQESQRIFDKNKICQNIEHLKNILEQKFKVDLSQLINNQEDQDIIIFIIYCNLMQKSLYYFPENKETFDTDYQII